MQAPKIRILDDGEIDGGIPEELDFKPKKKRSYRWRRTLRTLKALFLIFLIILVTALATLVASGKINLNDYEAYRRLCLLTLGPNRLAYVTYGTEESESIGLFTLMQADADSGRSCALDDQLSLGGTIAWSPSGTQIVYDSSASSGIRLAEADGSTIRTLIPQGIHGIWSPDGKHMLYVRQKDSQSALFVIDSDGNNEHQLLDAVADYAWLDNTSFALIHPKEPKGIFRMKLDGSETQLIAMGNDPIPSPDGKYLVYVETGSIRQPLIVSRIDGSNPQQIGTLPAGDSNDAEWSPNSRQIALTKSIGTWADRAYQIEVFDLDTSMTHQLTTDGKSLKPVWSPDGKRIVFTKIVGANTNIYVINADGTNEHMIVSNSHISATSLQWRPQVTN